MTTTKWGAPLPDVTAARDAAVSDPRTPLYGTPQTVQRDGLTYRYWRQYRWRTTITVRDTNETKTLEASSARDLREQIGYHNATLLAKHMSASVTEPERVTVWYADVELDTGEYELCQAPTFDALLLTVMKWAGETRAALIPPSTEHLPLMTPKAIAAGIASRDFMQIVGDQYTPTPRNHRLLMRYLREHELPMNAINILQAYDFYNDAGRLDQPGAEENTDE